MKTLICVVLLLCLCDPGLAVDKSQIFLMAATAYDFTSSYGLHGAQEANFVMGQNRKAQAIMMIASTAIVFAIGRTLRFMGSKRGERNLYWIGGDIHVGAGTWNHSFRFR